MTMPSTARRSLPFLPLLTLAAALSLAPGCGAESGTPQNVVDKPPERAQATPQPPPPPKIDWDARLDAAGECIAGGELDAAAGQLDELDAAKQELSEQQQRRLAKLHAQHEERQRLAADARREQALVAAEQALRDGDLVAATRSLDDVYTSLPSAEQKAKADELQQRIEDTRRIRRELGAAMRLLESEKRGDLRTARSRLVADAEVALPLLLEALQDDNPVLVSNTMEVLRAFNEPDRTLPAVIDVLANPEQSECWPAAIRELSKVEFPGAGPRLLELSLALEDPAHQSAMLTALASAADPPPNTLPALLPVVFQDGPALAPALLAAHHAVVLHRQTDLAARRGLPEQLTSEQEQRLAALGDRLRAIAEADVEDGRPGEAARAALMLGVATRQIEAQPLPGVSVSRTSYDAEDAPAAAVLDGQWASVDLKHMWKHPLQGRPLIVLDLGEVRTVTGIRIWNFNQAGATHRGWKEVAVFVSESPSLLRPVTSGEVPPAPGAAETADYSITLPVPYVRGRYVKLEPRSVWRDDGVGGGVTEIQVLGF